jgi:hypothetical protein
MLVLQTSSMVHTSKYLCWFTPFPSQLIWKLVSP